MMHTEIEIVEHVQRLVRERMAGQQAGHDVDHVLRVLKSAREIQAEVGGNRFVVELAALLHDLGDAKFHNGQERSAEFAREILSQFHLNRHTIEHVATIVDTISFRKAADRSTLSLEAKIVQDADRLDALGAIGIVRTIEYGAAIGQPFYLSENMEPKQKTGIDHFDEKLFKLHDLLNTDAARRIAGQREQFMRTFLEQFRHECGETK
ncbi:HD superfamily hydrolase [Rhodopirellula maiorica SM1]|uniref:HD superfamily hydrolase n=1 Tax=Rhodopirellula maiorica SM1 TaxID=1265738 RepID=M5RAF8_9BACT|nr:HD domain-containing protein [Rhodopirellula maiorica]EMI16345.1 HD superfamily hydrolase [Rhodopirellula maiorica SM1]